MPDIPEAAQPRKASLRSPELWVGLVLGAVIGRTVELIPDHTWAYIVIMTGLMVPTLMIKDRVTARLYEKRDAIVAKPHNHMPNRRRLLRVVWSIVDFVIGMLILLVPTFVLAWTWANLKPLG